jgi:hypothetical protein
MLISRYFQRPLSRIGVAGASKALLVVETQDVSPPSGHGNRVLLGNSSFTERIFYSELRVSW